MRLTERQSSQLSASTIAFSALLILSLGFSLETRTSVLPVDAFPVLTTVEALIGVLMAIWVVSLVQERRLPGFPPQIALAVLIWLLVLLCSTLAAPSQRLMAAMFVFRVVVGVLVGWASYDLLSSSRRAHVLALFLGLGGLLAALLALAESTGLPAILVWLSRFKTAPTRVGDVVRVSGPLSYATILSMVLEMTIPLMAAAALNTLSGGKRWLLGTGVLLMLWAQVLTLSRAGVVTLLAASGLLIGAGVYRGQRSWVRAGGAMLVVHLLLTGGLLLWNPVTQLRLTTSTGQSWYQASYETPATLHAAPGEMLVVPVTVLNTGDRTWTAEGTQLFMLSYHLMDSYGEVVTYDGARTLLSGDVTPGHMISLNARLEVPTHAGKYQVAWDMLQEEITWFSWQKAPVALTTLIVEGEDTSSPSSANTAAPTDIRVIHPTPVRRDLWRTALKMAANHPLLGVGPDNFRWRYGDYAGLTAWDSGIHANNLYIEWLADTGIIGLTAFLWMAWLMVKQVVRGALSSKVDPVLIGAAAALMTWFAHGLLDFFFEFTPTYVLFWIITGLALRLSEVVPEEDQGDARRI